MSNRRIAIFHNLPDGGGLRVINQISEYLERHSFDVMLFRILPKTVGENKKFSLPNITNQQTIHIDTHSNFVKHNVWIAKTLPKIHFKIAREINANFDAAIVSHDMYTRSPYILKYLKVPSIYVLHEPQREFYESWKYHAPYLKDKIANLGRWWIKSIDQRNTKFADKVVVNSKFSKNVVKKVYGRNSTVVYPGVDSTKFQPDHRVKSKNILCVGGLSRVKGHDFVVNSIAPILGEYTLTVVGDGRDKDKKHIIKSAGNKAKYIKFHHRITDTQLVSLYQRAMAVCVGAYKEPFGLTSLEAQACQTPVVAVDEGGIAETLIRNKTGYLTTRNKNEFLICVKKAVTNYKKLGKQGRKNVLRNWTWEKTLKNFDKLL